MTSRPKFTPAEERALLSFVDTLWQHIGSDCASACEWSGIPLDNESAIETLLDASRLESMLREEQGRVERGGLAREVPALPDQDELALMATALPKLRSMAWPQQVRWVDKRRRFA